MTSEAGSLMSHYGAVERTFQRGQPACRRHAYGFAELCTHTTDTDNSIEAAQGCPASYTYTSATGRTYKFKNLRPEIASRLEEVELQSLHAKNLALLQDLAYLDEDAPLTPAPHQGMLEDAAAASPPPPPPCGT